MNELNLNIKNISSYCTIQHLTEIMYCGVYIIKTAYFIKTMSANSSSLIPAHNIKISYNNYIEFRVTSCCSSVPFLLHQNFILCMQ